MSCLVLPLTLIQPHPHPTISTTQAWAWRLYEHHGFGHHGYLVEQWLGKLRQIKCYPASREAGATATSRHFRWEYQPRQSSQQSYRNVKIKEYMRDCLPRTRGSSNYFRHMEQQCPGGTQHRCSRRCLGEPLSSASHQCSRSPRSIEDRLCVIASILYSLYPFLPCRAWPQGASRLRKDENIRNTRE